MHVIKKYPLLFIVILGFILRVCFILVSDHTYYPDEVYQSLEQSFRLIKGYGIVPWDVIYGIRSYALPLFLVLPLKIAWLFRIEDPAIYRFFPQLLLLLASLTPIVAGYYLVKYCTKKTTPALFAAFCLAIWYELIYFSSRALTEIVAVYSFSFAIIALARSKKKYFFGSLLLTLGCLLRPHFFPIAIISYAAFFKPKDYKQAALGILTSTVFFGLIDWRHIGTFLGGLFRNIQLNFLAGISEQFGTQYWWYYLVYFAMTSAGISLLVFFPPKSRPAKTIWIAFISIVLIHTLIPHKEYRFIFICIPLWICLITVHLNTYLNRKKKTVRSWIGASVAFALLSLAGIFDKLPYQSTAYGQPMLLKDPDISIYEALYHDPTLCSLYDVSRTWVYTPGYYHLNRNVPLYSLDYPPANLEMISHFIVPKTDQQFAGMTRLMETNGYFVNKFGKPVWVNGYTVFKNDRTTCAPDTHYSRFRYFEAVQTVLQSVNAQPVIHE